MFNASQQHSAKYLKDIFTEQELSEKSVFNQWLTTAENGVLDPVATVKESLTVQDELYKNSTRNDYRAVRQKRLVQQHNQPRPK